ncbi:hypothetical protein M3626_20760 [Psychrobacillus sp. MER TA 17]|nr:hypothetical protein [Psychrobacillus sp. MER TA 17]
MSENTFIKLTHHKAGEPVLIRVDLVDRFRHHADRGYTLVKFKNGSGMYVLETVPEIEELLREESR